MLLRSLLSLLLLVCPLQASAATQTKLAEPITLRGGQQFLPFSVTWELLRSGFNTSDAALEAETYGEIWGIYRLNDFENYLLTRRGRARLVPLRLNVETAEGSWDTVVISEREFAKVLGIEHNPWHSPDAIIFLQLSLPESESQSIVLSAGPQYFTSISVSLL